jgi:aryl-alcohol dehydrogenase-like predicted oxidoreductase
MEASISKLAIGTAQFGLNYGINNVHGKITSVDMATTLIEARNHGIDTLDTAIAYGDSEQRLGEIGINGWKVITKLPPIPGDCQNIRKWIRQSIEHSLHRLGIPRIEGLLLHRPGQLLEQHGNVIHSTLIELQQEGLIQKIGISIYDPAELDPILSIFAMDLIQAPFNILDQRLIHSGLMDSLIQLGIEIHTRSIFLQGLLLMNSEERMRRFPRWKSLWLKYDSWLRYTRKSPLEACVTHALSCAAVSRVVVGIDNADHFRGILHAAKSVPSSIPREIAITDPDLLNPACWSQS